MSIAVLLVKVLPKTSKEEIVGWENGELKIRLKAVPEKGAANQALIAFLSKILKVPKQTIRLVRGETGRHKRLEISGMTQEQLEERLPIKNRL
ncbi:MAG: DUF167 domain-containing protein [Anaplasmataceae bacterium]|nr:DUF167 domain-containing protein [Anaplasmataceae bacterium]